MMHLTILEYILLNYVFSLIAYREYNGWNIYRWDVQSGLCTHFTEVE